MSKEAISKEIEEACEDITLAEVEEYFRLKKEVSANEARIKEINRKIKRSMLASNIKDTNVGDYKVKLGSQDRSKMNEDKLVKYLKDKGRTDLISIKEVPNEPLIEAAVLENAIDPKDLEECMDANIVWVLTVTKKKGSIGVRRPKGGKNAG